MNKELLAEFNRSNIINSAKKLFLEKGYKETTLEDICIDADYSKSTIYVYFRNKEEIYNFIICESMAMLKDKISECIQSTRDIEKCFFSICDRMVVFEDKYPLYFSSILGKISVSEEDFRGQPILKKIYTIGEEINLLIGNFITRGIDEHIFKPLNIPSAILMLWACIFGIISMTRQKSDYIKISGMNKREVLSNGFQMLYSSLMI